MVFSGDLVSIFSTILIANRNPFIYTPGIDNGHDDFGQTPHVHADRKLTDDAFEKEENLVTANIERSSTWV